MRSESWNPLLKSYPDSEKVNAVSIGAETLYTRLIAQSDDAGHYYGDASWVLAKLYTARMVRGEVAGPEVGRWLDELERAGLILRYDAAEATYLELVKCKKCLRRDTKGEMRFPAREDAGTEPGRIRDESVTERGHTRNESGPLNQDPDPHADPDPDLQKAPPPAAQPAVKALSVDIPQELQTDGFRQAWETWQTHRREIRKALTRLTASRQLADLAGMGEVRAIAAVEHSIKNGWTGLFEEKNHGNQKQQRQADKAGREFAEDIKLR